MLDLSGFEREIVSRVGAVANAPALYAHFDLLRRWNARLNLTAIRDEIEMVERHYCESIFLARHVPRETSTAIDFGTGAGFPGIPLAIERPELHVTLVESHQRKAVFLKEAARSLPNVSVAAKRIDDLITRADLLVSRAVDPTDVLKAAEKLAPLAMILAGDVELPARRRELLPWGQRRYLLFVEPGRFHVKQ